MTFSSEFLHDRPHGFIGREDVSPCVAEGIGFNATAKAFDGPLDILGLGNATGFEVVLSLKQGLQFGTGIDRVGREQSSERGFEVEVEKDATDVEEERHWEEIVDLEEERMNWAAWRAPELRPWRARACFILRHEAA